MALTRQAKTELIDDMSRHFEEGRGIIFVEYRGSTTKEIQALREKLHQANIDYKVTKTTLMKIALEKAGQSVPEEIFDKPLAIVFGLDDEITPSKITYQAAKEVENLKIIGGLINHEYLDASEVKKIAVLPGKDELYGQVVITLASPLTKMVNVLQANIRGLVSILSQYQSQIN